MGQTHFSGKLTSEATIADVLDKGSGAVILLDGEFLWPSGSTTFIMQCVYFRLICFHHFNVSLPESCLSG